MKVYTNIKTLKKVKRLLNDLNLGGMLDGKKVDINFAELLDKLLEEDKLVEFCQIVTKDTKTDFGELPAAEIGGLIDTFFTDMSGFLPGFLKEKINLQTTAKTSS